MKQSLAAFAGARAAALARTLRLELRRAMRAPGDPAAVHRARVAIRRFTQCLQTFKQFFDQHQTRKIRRRLRRVLDVCGAARNVDIALDVLTEAGVRNMTIVRALEKERSKKQEQMENRLKRWRKRKRWAALAAKFRINASAKGPWDHRLGVAENARHVLPGLAADLFKAGDQAALATSTNEELHVFRLKVKRFRYTLELFRAVYGASHDSEVAFLRDLQDKLGHISDCVTALALIARNTQAAKAVGRLLASKEKEFRRFWHSQAAGEQSRWISWLKSNNRA